jgi:uncharacterized protein YyaL (SSP411 family)
VNRIALAFAFALLLAPAACTGPAGAPPRAQDKGMVRKGTPDSVNVALARGSGRTQAFEWSAFSPETFERARREGKFILIDGAAEWCHWCHVMDATTYLDPEIGKILHDKFVTIRVDIDERPDIGERYGAWGWPATILMTPGAEELGKYRGYLPPEELREILQKVGTVAAEQEQEEAAGGAKDAPPPVAAVGWIAGRVTVDLDSYYDPKEGGWGRMQKSPIGGNAEFEAVRAGHGDKAALGRLTFSLAKQRALLDPVWGGVYQYSASTNWNEPHFEKLMTFQAANLEAYARAFALTKDDAIRRDATMIAKYMTTFLSNAEGAFLPTQDADVGAHDPGAKFVDGHVYYALGDVERRALGIPRVDPHVYPFENGIAIAALVTLHEATADADLLVKARRAADLVLRTLVTDDGLVKRAASPTAVRHLADAAAFGRGLVRLSTATSEPRYREAAIKIAAAIARELEDKASGAFFDHTVDPAAAGVFARRERSFANNLLAARFFSALAKATGDAALREVMSTPRALDARGRMLGDYLLALDEAGLYPW